MLVLNCEAINVQLRYIFETVCNEPHNTKKAIDNKEVDCFKQENCDDDTHVQNCKEEKENVDAAKATTTSNKFSWAKHYKEAVDDTEEDLRDKIVFYLKKSEAGKRL